MAYVPARSPGKWVMMDGALVEQEAGNSRWYGQ